MWFDLLKWLSEQENATTVADLQMQVDALIQIGKQDIWLHLVIMIAVFFALLVLMWYAIGLEKRIKKLEAALPEKRADSPG